MSTGKTEHIQLNQWAPQDDFLRVEFNEDNRKIDSAMVALREEFQEGDLQVETALKGLREEVNAGDRQLASALEGLREEFKEGDQRLEAALPEYGCETLLDVTTGSDATTVELDVSGIDFTQYWRIEMFLSLYSTGTFYLRLNNLTDDYYQKNLESTQLMDFKSPAQIPYIIHMVPSEKEKINIFLWYVNYGTYYFIPEFLTCRAPLTWPDLTTMSFIAASESAPIPAGTRFALKGVKR